jgi:formylglycine-generating enzyme required for sulfatase activity
MDTEAETVPEAQSKAKIFISYSRKDMGFTDRLETALKSRGFEPLIDRNEIYAFEDWWKRIQTLIDRADTVVFALSPDAVKSDVALKEVAYAASLNKRFAPIVCRRVDDNTVPEALRQLNFVFFDDPEHFDERTDRLAEALRTDIGWVRQHTEYGEAERRWSAAGGPRGLLLHSPTLEVAEYWIGSQPAGAPSPTDEIRAYVAASQKAARSAQRTWRLVLASTFTFMAATILGLVGWINQDYIVDQWRWWTVTRPYAEAQVWPYVLTAARDQALSPGDSFKECARDCPEMLVVPAGSFVMGAPPTDSGMQRYESEIPQHPVTIAKAFAVAKYELTFADWDACIAGGGCKGYRPNDFGMGRGQKPVIAINWDDAREYVSWLSQVTGKTYRLLSEAEYEYAARAGTSTAYPWGDAVTLDGSAMANCDGCGSQWDNRQTAPVGSFPPNKFGLYDMVGNVWSWTDDCYREPFNYKGAPTDGSAWIQGGTCQQRTAHGSSWNFSPVILHAANRFWHSTLFRSYYLGLRVARSLAAGVDKVTVAPAAR